MSIPDARAFLLQELRRLRLADGTIPIFFSSDRDVMQDVRTCRSNFFYGLMLSVLQNADAASRAVLADLSQGLARVVRAEITPQGTVNYWTQDEPLRAVRPYPDDFDTTSCSLAGLIQAGEASSAGALLGGVVRALTSLETREGGPYRTWLVPPNAADVWKDTDVAVNANIAFLLSLHDIRLEPLDTWLSEQIHALAHTSPYYPSVHPVWYFLSRATPDADKETLARHIIAARLVDGSWGNIMETAFALAALRRLKSSTEIILDGQAQLATRLLSAVRIPTGACCMDADEDGHVMYAGSPALTAALCLEALADTAALVEKASVVPPVAQEELAVHASLALISRRAKTLGDPLGSQLRKWSERILQGERGREIPLLPHRFHTSLTSPVMTDAELHMLGAANIYGWIAYTIYDDLLDEEGSGTHLPIANISLRSLGAIYARLVARIPDTGKLYTEVMDDIERANAWEVSRTRIKPFTSLAVLPEYGDFSVLARRSFGHALGPLTILLAAGYGYGSPQFSALSGFFKHALIARQLDDDGHDWEQDLAAGRINAVAALTLRAWRDSGRRLDQLQGHQLDALIQFFWEWVIEEVATCMLDHIRFAEAHLSQLSFLKQDDALRALLVPSRTSAERALQGAREAKAFLTSYQGVRAVSPGPGSEKNS